MAHYYTTHSMFQAGADSNCLHCLDLVNKGKSDQKHTNACPANTRLGHWLYEGAEKHNINSDSTENILHHQKVQEMQEFDATYTNSGDRFVDNDCDEEVLNLIHKKQVVKHNRQCIAEVIQLSPTNTVKHIKVINVAA